MDESDLKQELADLLARTDAARKELASVQRELRELKLLLSQDQALHLLQANEQLVLSAMQAQQGMDTIRDEMGSLTEASQRDLLTGLPNRALMLDRMHASLALARRRGGLLAVLFIDLDGFKAVNDNLGHAAGDAALCTVADCLTALVRDSDTASRQGGDEFLLLLNEVSARADAVRVANKILAKLAEPGCFSSPEVNLSASIGIALYPQDGSTVKTLIAAADAAMYRAKQAGGARHDSPE